MDKDGNLDVTAGAVYSKTTMTTPIGEFQVEVQFGLKVDDEKPSVFDINLSTSRTETGSWVLDRFVDGLNPVDDFDAIHIYNYGKDLYEGWKNGGGKWASDACGMEC